MKEIWKERLTQSLFVAGSLCLYLVLNMVQISENPISADGKIVRNQYGDHGQDYQVTVLSEDESGTQTVEFPMGIFVSSQSYSQKEAERVFETIMQGMEERIRGDNPSLMEVTQDLHLPKALDEFGVRLRWYSSNPELMDASGILKSDIEKESLMSLHVQLSAEEYKADYELAVRVLPRKKNKEETLISALRHEIERLDEEQKCSEYLQLPLEYEGRRIWYQTEKSSRYVMLPFLGILMAVIWPARRQSELRKAEKKREQELLLDYAEIVSKLMVFIGAGMTVRNAWERMVMDYEHRNDLKQRAAYEEMRYTYYQWKNGVPESKAYQDFGRRCRLQPYLKLSSLLEQNRRTGTKDLRKILQIELTDAFELRKNLARRMGEEAGTKLLLPLFLLLGIVMVMIMVPAMMTMG